MNYNMICTNNSVAELLISGRIQTQVDQYVDGAFKERSSRVAQCT